MAIEKMTLVNITGSLSALDPTLLRCYQSGGFHPEHAAAPKKESRTFKTVDSENPYLPFLNRILSLSAAINVSLKYIKHSDHSVDLNNAGCYLDRIEDDVLSLSKKSDELKQVIRMHAQTIDQIHHIENLKVNIDDIFSCKYVRVRFGRLPYDSYLKLSHYKNDLFFFFPFEHNQDFCWGVYFAPNSAVNVIDSIFESLYFERIWIPDFVHGTPQLAIDSITELCEKETSQLNTIQEQLACIIKKEIDGLEKLYSKLRFLSDTFELRKYVLSYKNHFYMTGFVPQNEVEDFVKLFDDLDSAVCTVHPHDSDSRMVIPVKLKNNRFTRPFEMFVEMYGLPNYSDIDPTPFFAIVYTLIFGIMFGDLGQGIIISIVGWFLWKFKQMPLGKILQRIGLSSAAFGFVYGSVFGFEHLLDPVYKSLGMKGKPVEVFDMINNLLLFAVGIGIVIIIVSIIFNIILGVRKKDAGRVIFSNNGIAGLVFYASVICAAVLKMFYSINILSPVFIVLCIAFPLVMMFLREPLTKLIKREKGAFPKTEIGGFIAETFFEVFEYLLSFITNTVSFLRIGGFIISHAGMMAVVMILSETVGSAAHPNPIVMIIGNIFVMAMEGLIVGIQVLRLHYYEIFSRFYEGDGKPYAPAKAPFDIEN